MFPLLIHFIPLLKSQKCYGFYLCLDCLLKDSTPSLPIGLPWTEATPFSPGLKQQTPRGSSCCQPHPSLPSITKKTQQLHPLHIINNICKIWIGSASFS